MTIQQFMDKAMPVIGPLPDRQRALALAHVADAVRGRDDVDEALAARLIAELRQRFSRPLA